MQSKINGVDLLDCTLRDGAYLVDKKFGDSTIEGIISGLVQAKIDLIEVGFFQNDGFGEGKTVFKNSSDVSRFIPKDKGSSQFTVLADFSRYDVNKNLDERREDSIDGVRECFFKSERFAAIDYCKTIKKRGYKLFVQPVDILGYTDKELLEFIEVINEIEPYCFSIVDTFGSMYQEDLHRVFEIINHNLISSCKIGFHSHNNMQLSSALSQEFVRISEGKREVVVDATIAGMGRGAGNTPTELVAQYLVSQRGYSYDIDSLLDIIDDYMEDIREKCTWGYSTEYFIAGTYGAHVNNIKFLKDKNSIRSKDIGFILNKIGPQARKRYDYDLLEKTYLELVKSEIDDSETIKALQEKFKNNDVLMLSPGHSISTKKAEINAFISEKNPIVIASNFLPEDIKVDYIYVSNLRRYNALTNKDKLKNFDKIMTSNVPYPGDDRTAVISFTRLIKCGWDFLDNSSMMLLRLLDLLNVKSINIAGLDGYLPYPSNPKKYGKKEYEYFYTSQKALHNNEEMSEMLQDYMNSRINKDVPVYFITESRFEDDVEI